MATLSMSRSGASLKASASSSAASISAASISGGSSRVSLGGGARLSIMRAGSVYGGAGSMYGGAGGAGVRVSGSSRVLSMGGGLGISGGIGIGGGAGLSLVAGAGGGFSLAAMKTGVIGNGKFTMQNLNDRLAAYLAKVRTLEKANGELELKIRQFLDARVGPEFHDYKALLAVISDLQAKILGFISTKGSIHLSLDNANLAVNDYKLKYENEAALRQTAEADVAGLKAVLADLNFAKGDLTARLTGLSEDVAALKKNHGEDLIALRTKVGHKVNVDIEVAPQDDLTAVLNGVRQHYESVAAKNKSDLEAWFQAKTESLKTEVTTTTSTLQVSSSEVTSLKSTVQALQIELMSIASMKVSLEATLSETQTRYASMLSVFQGQVGGLEAQLASLRAQLETQSAEYKILLDIKTKLELEIAEYTRLLDGQYSSAASSSSSTRTKYLTVVEEVVDGKVVSSKSSSSNFLNRMS